MYQENPLGQLAAFAICVLAGAVATVGISLFTNYREKVAVETFKKTTATAS